MKLILVPVGTSLKEKEEIKAGRDTVRPKDIGEEHLRNKDLIKTIIEILNSLDIEFELDKRNNKKHGNNSDQFSAEISSLLLFLSKEEKAIKIDGNKITQNNNFDYKIKLFFSVFSQRINCD